MRRTATTPSLAAILLSALVATIVTTGHAMQDADEGLMPGATIDVYDIGAALDRMPTIIDGQTPNLSVDVATIDRVGPWETPFGPLAERFCGTARGWIVVEQPGSYVFRVIADDGAALHIDEALVTATVEPGRSIADGRVELDAGHHPFRLDFYQNDASVELHLLWRPPGATTFATVPTRALRTEVGQTHVSSPGPKRWYFPSAAGAGLMRPGDGRPLEGVHPSFTLETFRPVDYQPAVGGMAFLPDGRLAICTWDRTGAVDILDHLDGPPEDVTITRFASGLGEPLGLAFVDGDLWVAQKQEITRLRDLDGDGVADRYEAVVSGWPASFNYHEFTFNLVAKDGMLWATTSVPLKSGVTMYVPGSDGAFAVPNGPGSLLRIDPRARTWAIVATGLRTPNGLGIGPDGELFGADNQGSWLPCSRLNHLHEGGFYGHQLVPDGQQPTEPPVLWLPHGEIGNSPSEPVLVRDGPYAGQMLFGDVTHGGVKRAFIEKVDGRYQGAAFRFTQGVEAGINRLAWGPDGALYLGGIGSNGNWNHRNRKFGLQRLRPNGTSTFEILAVRTRADGFIIDFTQPADAMTLGDVEHYAIQQWRYAPTIEYGGPKLDVETLRPAAALVAPDRTRVFLAVPGLTAGRVVHLRLRDIVNDAGEPPWSTEAWYTLNALGAEAGPGFLPRPVLAAASAARTLEAEHASYDGPRASTEWSGWSGDGYLDFQQPRDEFVDWTIDVGTSGRHRLSIRYANGTANEDRPLRLEVDGVAVTEALHFPVTGGWTNWSDVDVELDLARGPHHVRLVATGASGPNIDALRVTALDTAPPPPGATVLFDGVDVSAWRTADDRDWPVEDGALVVGRGDLLSRETFEDVLLHVEWNAPPGGRGQLAGNSGVKLMRRYEVQILNHAAGADEPASTDAAGAIYGRRRPDHDASREPGAWQTYDLRFRAPRWRDGAKIEDARLTVAWNGVIVHDDVALSRGTGQSPLDETPGPDSILLQAHATAADGPVRFRTIWILRPPRLVDAPDLITTVGAPVAHVPTTSGGAPAWCVITPPLPDGLTFDAATGAINGAATAPGRSTHRLLLMNAAGTAEGRFTITIAAPTAR
ncbi:MAG: DUF1080 domain-containing protein [Phycisphaerales bacterium]|nr:DUF1080 domain-containing protein [Phycisphaerales bacterium]